LFDLFFFLLLMDGRIVSLVAAGEVAGGSFVGDGLDRPTMLLPSGTAWFAVPEAARFSTETGSSLGRCFGGDSAVVVGRFVVSGA
jgi:hypothetical protein